MKLRSTFLLFIASVLVACGKPAEPTGSSAPEAHAPAAEAKAPEKRPEQGPTFVERKITLVYTTLMDLDGNSLEPPKTFNIPVTVRVPDGWELAKDVSGALFDGNEGSFQLRPKGAGMGEEPYVMITASPVLSTDPAVFDRDWTGSSEDLAASTKAKVLRYELLRPGQGVYVIEGKRWTEVTSRQWISNGKDRPLQVSFEAFLDNADKALIAAVVESCTHMVVGAPVPK